MSERVNADNRALRCALELAHRDDPQRIGDLLEVFRAYLLVYSRRKWGDDERRKMGDSDLVQLTLLKAIERFDEFRGKTSEELAAWLRTILHHLMISQRRKMKAKKAYAGAEAPIEDAAVVDKAPSARQRLITAEMKQRVLAALKSLPPHYKQVVELRQFEKLAFEEIGERIDSTPEAARKLFSRAIAKLGLALKAQGDSSFQNTRG